MVKVELKAFQRGTPCAYGAAIELGDKGSGLYENVNYGDIGLDRLHVHAFHLRASENGARHEERCRGAPIALDFKVCGLVALPSAHPEGDAGAAAPVLFFDQLGVSLHLAAGGDAEVAEHIERDVHVRDALGLGDV